MKLIFFCKWLKYYLCFFAVEHLLLHNLCICSGSIIRRFSACKIPSQKEMPKTSLIITNNSNLQSMIKQILLFWFFLSNKEKKLHSSRISFYFKTHLKFDSLLSFDKTFIFFFELIVFFSSRRFQTERNFDQISLHD